MLKIERLTVLLEAEDKRALEALGKIGGLRGGVYARKVLREHIQAERKTLQRIAREMNA